MIVILKEYLHYRKGVDSDYLFCTESGEMLTENALRSSIFRYNTDRGVEKNSIHLFRHTFAKKFLIDCGGNAFTLQKILGHSTLDMTRHYCNIFNVDLVKNYDSFSPLQQLTSKEKRITLKQK
jgi:integrase/recombinase XerD